MKKTKTNNLLAKLRPRKSDKPGDLINRAKTLSQKEKLAIKGLV